MSIANCLGGSIGAASLAVMMIFAAAAPPALAQAPTCQERNLDDPPRVMFDCGGGILIEKEAATAMGFVAGNGTTLNLTSGAVLVEVNQADGGFQIRTPQAIASVRGTIYAVDVSDGRTSVFVQRGVVEVSELEGDASVSLHPGEGVDVTSGEPLVVREWGAARVAALLARFGR